MSKIIPDSLIEDYESLAKGAPETEDVTPEQKEQKTQALNALNNTIKQVLELGDSMAKENDLAGLGKIPADDFARLLGIVAERNFSPAMIEKSPEIACVSMCGYIIVTNATALRRKKLRQANQEPEQAPEN